MTLQNYIKDLGQAKAARVFKVSPQRINKWVQLQDCPRPKEMVKIVHLTKGLVGYGDIIEPYVSLNYQLEFDLD